MTQRSRREITTQDLDMRLLSIFAFATFLITFGVLLFDDTRGARVIALFVVMGLFCLPLFVLSIMSLYTNIAYAYYGIQVPAIFRVALREELHTAIQGVLCTVIAGLLALRTFVDLNATLALAVEVVFMGILFVVTFHLLYLYLHDQSRRT